MGARILRRAALAAGIALTLTGVPAVLRAVNATVATVMPSPAAEQVEAGGPPTDTRPDVFLFGLANPAPPPVSLTALDPTGPLAYQVRVESAPPGDLTAWSAYLGSVPAMGSGEAELAGALYSFVNHERRRRGLEPLDWADDLAHSALFWNRHMQGKAIAHSSFLHQLPDRYVRTAENVGMTDPGDAARMHAALAASSRHLASIVDPRYDVVGIAVGCTSKGALYVTQHFGTRRADTPLSGRSPAWRSDGEASVGPTGTRAPARCAGARPASQDPAETTTTTSPPASPAPTTTTTRPSSTTTSSTSSTTTTSSSTSTTSTSTSTSTTTTTTSSTSTSSSTTSTTQP